MKNYNDTIGNQTHELPASGAVPQPTALPRHNSRYIYHFTTSKSLPKGKILIWPMATNITGRNEIYIYMSREHTGRHFLRVKPLFKHTKLITEHI